MPGLTRQMRAGFSFGEGESNELASFHHGTRLSESNETPVLVQVAQTAVVGLLGTAPDADATKFPLNTPVLLKGTPTDAADLGLPAP